MAATVDEYIAGFPPKTQAALKKVRKAIQQAAPQATEKISYRIAAYEQHGALIYFAGYTDYVGVYPRTAGMAKYEKEFAAYASGKGTLRFPLGEPMPLPLIAKLVKVRVAENEQRALAKKKTKKPKAPAKKTKR